MDSRDVAETELYSEGQYSTSINKIKNVVSETSGISAEKCEKAIATIPGVTQKYLKYIPKIKKFSAAKCKVLVLAGQAQYWASTNNWASPARANPKKGQAQKKGKPSTGEPKGTPKTLLGTPQMLRASPGYLGQAQKNLACPLLGLNPSKVN